jgi:2-deoxy-D-gluconate 3-dehydrogenase
LSQFDLTGRVALVTGGNGGIGLGIARGLAGAGASVVIAGRSTSKNEAAAAELSALGAPCHALEVDVADADACRAMVEAAHARFGRLDILVNNAGIGGGGRPETLNLATWNRVLQTNLTGSFVTAQAAYPLMQAAGGGKIINIASGYAIFGAAGVAAYGASKGGLVQLTKALAVAWARDNIQVNAIIPGWIATDMTRGAQTSAEFNARVIGDTPAGRWGEPADFAGPAVFLASAASTFVTGASLVVDGGFTISA